MRKFENSKSTWFEWNKIISSSRVWSWSRISAESRSDFHHYEPRSRRFTPRTRNFDLVRLQVDTKWPQMTQNGRCGQIKKMLELIVITIKPKMNQTHWLKWFFREPFLKWALRLFYQILQQRPSHVRKGSKTHGPTGIVRDPSVDPWFKVTNSAGSVRRQFILGWFLKSSVIVSENDWFKKPMKDSQRSPKILSFKENQNGDLERFFN